MNRPIKWALPCDGEAELVQEYQRATGSIARRYAQTIDYEDAYSVASIGTLYAVRRWLTEEEHTTSLLSMVMNYSKSAVIDEIRKTFGRGEHMRLLAVPFPTNEDGDSLIDNYKGGDAEDEAMALLECGVLSTALQWVNERGRMILVQSYLHGHTLADIAIELGISESRVAQLRVSAIEQLKAAYFTKLVIQETAMSTIEQIASAMIEALRATFTQTIEAERRVREAQAVLATAQRESSSEANRLLAALHALGVNVPPDLVGRVRDLQTAEPAVKLTVSSSKSKGVRGPAKSKVCPQCGETVQGLGAHNRWHHPKAFVDVSIVGTTQKRKVSVPPLTSQSTSHMLPEAKEE